MIDRYKPLYESTELSRLSRAELEDLKDKIRSKPFLNPEDMETLGLIDHLLTGFNPRQMKVGKTKNPG